jgi:GH15 family glucan-1,4-alpha-glucosidase
MASTKTPPIQGRSHEHSIPRRSKTYLPIEDYGVIGDLQTVALVGRNGSIDWYCIPCFDAPSVFGAILDAEKGGSFRIAPPDSPGMSRKQMYLPETNVLITRFLTVDGICEITDFMPVENPKRPTKRHHLIRAVKVIRGTLSFELDCRPAFNYARDPHTLEIVADGAIFRSATLSLALSSSVPLQDDGHGGAQATFTLQEGQLAVFLLDSSDQPEITPRHYTTSEYGEDFYTTERYWEDWLANCRYQGRWREMVQRSALALKLLTYAPTGAIVAAATTSLPEAIGGPRNWDYRFTWLRDAAFTIYSLLMLGLTEEADAFAQWLLARSHELAPDGSLQPMYTIHGGHDMPEFTLDHLEGYRQSGPVRIGNAAYKQIQLDIYGEMMDSIYLFNRHRDLSYDEWTFMLKSLEWLSEHWQELDEGIWEVRGQRQPFVHSRVMSWVAFDRALRIARHRGFPAPQDEWQKTSATIYNEVMEHGWNAKRGAFVQYYGSDALDASTLLISLTRFTGPSDPRMLSTIDRIQAELTSDTQVFRYDPELAADDGVGGEEGAFSICSFWMVEALTRAGRLVEARLALEKMLTYANHVGLYAEEIGATGEALGNFPQAFTHLALIRACYELDRALNAAQRGKR